MSSSSSSSSSQNKRKDITIIGGGIIGCSAAYFLTRHPFYSPETHRITLLEAAASSSRGGRAADSSLSDPATLAYPDGDDGVTGNNSGGSQQKLNPAHEGIAGAASGKAGGLLALWAFPSNIVPLSFRLHEELAREHGGERRWGYRKCWASQVECEARLPGSFATADAEGVAAGSKGDDAVGGSGGRSNEAGNTKGLHKDHKKSAAALKRLGAPEDLDWLVMADRQGNSSGGLRAYENMGTPDNTAQVHPELFTRSMAALAEEKGVKIVTAARVTRINYSNSSSAVESVTYSSKHGQQEEEEQETTLPTTDCILAAGPWTNRLLPGVPVSASRAHSVVIQPPRPVSAYALFTAINLPSGFPAPSSASKSSGISSNQKELLKRPTMVEPEIYARPDGTAYACGPTDSDVELPLTSEGVVVDEARCADILEQVGAISDELNTSTSSTNTNNTTNNNNNNNNSNNTPTAKVLARQACYLPQGGPWIGPVPGKPGLVVAAGHTCWGIQNGPGTGKLVSEIVLDGKAKSAKLGGCDPARVM